MLADYQVLGKTKDQSLIGDNFKTSLSFPKKHSLPGIKVKSSRGTDLLRGYPSRPQTQDGFKRSKTVAKARPPSSSVTNMFDTQNLFSFPNANSRPQTRENNRQSPIRNIWARDRKSSRPTT